MKLIIAEKPDLARNVAGPIGKCSKHHAYVEVGNFKIDFFDR
ncbi:hypothetical protein VLK81_07015 [Citroniella saccharovorans]|uniref:DNA topoisomerase III n=1 Tax=Citroniella saccharovorans TaxID=2053367 RepID=A0AAW9MUR2_9FIRM|nr:hypothetical protein [Citroniella saccharovorans]MEB3429760.1 hypothetical protein [Citroniella saccharovorans]